VVANEKRDDVKQGRKEGKIKLNFVVSIPPTSHHHHLLPAYYPPQITHILPPTDNPITPSIFTASDAC